MRILRILAVALLAAVAISCQKEPVLELSGSQALTFASKGGSQNFSFITNSDWTVSPSESWCRVSQSSGEAAEGPITLTVTCEVNTSYDERSCTVTVQIDGLSATVAILQSQADGLIADVSSLLIDCQAQDQEVPFQTNIEDFQVRIPADVSWVSVASVKALQPKTLVLHVEKNTTEAARETRISIERGALSQTVFLKQLPYNKVMDSTAPGIYGLGGADYGYRPGVGQLSKRVKGGDIIYSVLDQEKLFALSMSGVPQQTELGQTFDLGVTVVNTAGPVLAAALPVTVIGVSEEYLRCITADNAGVLIKK